MEVLKKQSKSRSRVKTFYDKFSRESSTSNSSSDESEGVFKFNVKAPVLKTDSDTYSNWSSSYQPPISPGLTKNQDVKDQAYAKLFTRRIDDLKSEIPDYFANNEMYSNFDFLYFS